MTGLQASVSAGISIGDIEKIVDGAVGALSRPDPRPFYFTRAASVISTGAAGSVLNFFGPPTGSLWQIRFITTFGSDAYTSLNNGASPAVPLLGALYAGDPSTSPSLAQLLATGFQFPSTTFFPDTTVWCHPNQSLFVVTGGGYTPSAGQQIGAVVGLEEWREEDVSRNSGR